MPQKVDLNKIRTFGETIDDTILFFKQNWKPLLKCYLYICGFFWIAGLIISFFNELHTFQLQENGQSIFTLTYWGAVLFGLINYTLLSVTTLSFIVLYHAKEKEAPTVEEVWSYVKYYFFRMLGSYLAITIAIGIGLVLCIIPGIYLIPVCSLIITIMVIENTSLRYAFNRAFSLISDNWWHTFGVMLVIVLLTGITTVLVLIPAAIIAGIIVFVTGNGALHIFLLALTIAAHLVQFLNILVIIAVALIYYNLTELKEDLTLLERIEMLGKTNPQVNSPDTDETY